MTNIIQFLCANMILSKYTIKLGFSELFAKPKIVHYRQVAHFLTVALCSKLAKWSSEKSSLKPGCSLSSSSRYPSTLE